jgi:DNA polymerase-1
LSLEQCSVLRNDAFFELWGGLPDYYRTVVDDLKKTGYVSSPLGRRRRLENIWSDDQSLRAAAARDAINTPNQGLASDVALIGTMEAERGLAEEGFAASATPIAFIHDAAIFECDAADASEVAHIVKYSFQDLTVIRLREDFGVDFDVPLVADIKVETAWSL